MPTQFEERMAVRWDSYDRSLYGVVTRCRDESIDVTPVFSVASDTVCYDESGSIRGRDEHNVKLRSCPPPFSMLCIMGGTGQCYALADPNAAFTFYEDDLPLLDILDDGDKISEKDLAEIFDHPWRDEKEYGLKPDVPKKPSAVERMRRAMPASERDRAHGDSQFDF